MCAIEYNNKIRSLLETLDPFVYIKSNYRKFEEKIRQRHTIHTRDRLIIVLSEYRNT